MRIIRPLRPLWLTTLAASALAFLGTSQIYAQPVSEYQVKAAYLYNFAKFVEWPPQSFPTANSAFRFCVLNDESFAEELARTVMGKVVGGRAAEVIPVKNAGEARSCQIVFISASETAPSEFIKTCASNVLTVGETNDFAKQGGMINFVMQNNRVQFQVNHRAAAEAGLRISSRLLSVAKLVIE